MDSQFLAVFNVLKVLIMKNLLFVLISIVSASVLSVRSQTAEILLRPAYLDLSSSDAPGAVLVNLSGYASNDARYRLFNGSYQYYCWNAETGNFVSSNSYSSGPLVAGSPVTGTSFWILYKRGSNNSVTATYRDRLGPEYSINYQSIVLPAATEIVNRFTLSGKIAEDMAFPLTNKYVILAWSGSTFISASHSNISTGEFSIDCPAGITIDKIEARTIKNEPVGTKTGAWNQETVVGEIIPGVQTKVYNPQDTNVVIYPVPVHDWLSIENIMLFKTIEIYNLTGKIISVNEIQNQNIVKIDFRHFPAGIYFIKLKAPGVNILKRLIKN